MINVLLLFVVQSIYSLTDLGKKFILNKSGYGLHLITNWKFVLITVSAVVGFALHMFVLSRYDLSKTTIVIGVLAVVISSTLGIMVLKEHLSPINYLGLAFAVLAIILVQIK